MQIKCELGSEYEKLNERACDEGLVIAWISRDLEDSKWDSFLISTPLGQFQQSTIWARAKRAERWAPTRVVFTIDNAIVGGFQILKRFSPLGRVGYVSKGPIILPTRGQLAHYAGEMLREVVELEGLTALIVHPPDECQQMPISLVANGFIPNVLTGVNEATWITDLGCAFEITEGRISKWTRKKIRQAKNRGVSIREGGRTDVTTFFGLMLSTCQRQGVKPSPSNEDSLMALWDAANLTGCIRLTLAEYEGRPLAGLICICFGQTASLWKKGWTSLDGQLHPNELLTYEMLEWANSRGYKSADFTAIDIDIAVRMVRGEALSQEQERSRHMFNIRFGGRATLLPEARVYFPNPFVRWVYRFVFKKKIIQAEDRRESVAQVLIGPEDLHSVGKEWRRSF